MTAPPTPITDEQLTQWEALRTDDDFSLDSWANTAIQELGAEVRRQRCALVSMREALGFYANESIYELLATDIDANIDCGKTARSALSTSADYANKVVVDRGKWERAVNQYRGDIRDAAARLDARLDSLSSQQGGGE